MSADAAALMAQVEDAMRRVMAPTTAPSEKAQLERELKRLQTQVAACLPVVYALLETSRDPYALWFAATTLEQYVAARWRVFPAADKRHLRERVWQHVLIANASQVPFVLQKLRKVLADIARLEWTTSADPATACTWPECWQQVEGLVVVPATRVDGLALLSVMSEEFGREDALAVASRKRAVQAQMQAQVPQVMALLAHVLQEAKARLHMQLPEEEARRCNQTAQLAMEVLLHLVAWITSVADALQDDWLAVLVEWSVLWQQTPSYAAILLDGASLAALRCLTEVLGQRVGMPRVDMVVSTATKTLQTLLQCAMADASKAVRTDTFTDQVTECLSVFLTQHGARLQHPQHEQDGVRLLEMLLAWTTQCDRLDAALQCFRVWDSVLASMLAVAPQDEDSDGSEPGQRVRAAFEPLLVQVLRFTMDSVGLASNALLYGEFNVDDDDQAEAEPADPYPTLREDDWASNARAYGTSSLQDIAQLFATRAVGGEDVTTAVELSECRQFVVETLALIRRLAGLRVCFQPLLESILPRVQDTFQRVVLPLAADSPVASGDSEHVQIHDLTVDCAILGGIPTPHAHVWPMLQLLLAVNEHLVRHRLFARSPAFARLHAESLACLRPGLVSLPPMLLQAQTSDEAQQVVERVLQVVLHSVEDAAAIRDAKQSALQVLATLAAILRQQSELLLQVPTMIGLRDNLHTFSQRLPILLQGDLFKAMAHVVLQVPVATTDTSQTAAKDHAYASLVRPFCVSLEQAAQQAQADTTQVTDLARSTQSVRDCFLVHCLASAVESKPMTTKRAFWQAVAPAWHAQQMLLTVCVKTQAVNAGGISQTLRLIDAIMHVQAQLLQALRKVMDKSTVTDVLSGFVALFADAQLSEMLNRQGTQGLRILAGFLRLLAVVMDEPTTAFASFVPTILDLCFGTLQESIFRHPASDELLLGPFVQLVEQILDKHFRCFVSAASARTMPMLASDGASASRDRAFVSEIAQTSFTVLFQSLTAILARADEANPTGSPDATTTSTESDPRASVAPRLGAQVLTLLDRVDKTHGLFAFAGFHDMRLALLSTLLRGLRSGALHVLQDQVVALVHRLAAVDFAGFYQQFLPTFTQEMLSPAQLDAARVLSASGEDAACLQWSGQVDLPTFTQDVLGYLHDLRVLQAQATE